LLINPSLIAIYSHRPPIREERKRNKEATHPATRRKAFPINPSLPSKQYRRLFYTRSTALSKIFSGFSGGWPKGAAATRERMILAAHRVGKLLRGARHFVLAKYHYNDVAPL
jgi:hypothetical protein